MNLTKNFDKDIEITKKKWDERYRDELADDYDPKNIPIPIGISSSYAKRFLLDEDEETNRVFLEAGCGTARTSLTLSLEIRLTIICSDISINALKKAKELFNKNNPNAKVYFVCCDLRYLPFKDNSINFIFSDGAIEHFRNTYLAVREFYRILDLKGKVFVTVPYLSLGMLTYGQIQGNIPNT